MPLLKIDVRHVSKTFHRRRGNVDWPIAAVRDISLQISAGEFVCLVGPSGCGKTTLLRLVHGLLEPDSGEVLVDGRAGVAPGPHAGFVFQSFRLLPWRSVLDNVEFPLQIQGMPQTQRASRARRYLRLVGLEDFEHSYPHELSGGMQQRVGLARALALEPRILLMDEPFAALDAQTREFMQIELSRIWEQLGIAVLFVTCFSALVQAASRRCWRCSWRDHAGITISGLPQSSWNDVPTCGSASAAWSATSLNSGRHVPLRL